MVGMGIAVELSGPLFDQRGPAIIKEAGVGAVRELADKGSERLATVLTVRPQGVYKTVAEARGRGWRTRNPKTDDPASGGNYSRHVSATTKGLHAVISDGGVIYGPWLEGTSSRNQTTRFKGYASFRKTSQWLQKESGGVLEKHIKKAVARYNA